MQYFRCPKCNRNCTTFDQIHNSLPHIHSDDFIEIESGRKDILTCVHCGSPTVAAAYHGNPNILIENCDKCGWRGFETLEFIKIIQGSEQLRKKEELLLQMSHDIGQSSRKRLFLSDLTDTTKKLSRPGWVYYPFFLNILLPISSERDKTAPPLATFSLILLNTLIYIILVSVGDSAETAKTFLLWPADVRHMHKLYGLITHCFLHASIPHLFFNMYFLWLFGASVEDKLKPLYFLGFYFFSCVISGLGFTLINYSNNIPSLGASGAISGMLGAFVIFCPYRRIKILVRVETIEVPAVIYLFIWILWQVIYGYLGSTIMLSNIAYSAHITGFMTGLVFALIWNRLKNKMYDRHYSL